MGIVRLLDYLAERRRTLVRITLVVMALLVVLDVILPAHYDRFFWETIGGFGAFYGFVSAVVLIAVAKGLGYALLYRREDYYEAGERSAGDDWGSSGDDWDGDGYAAGAAPRNDGEKGR